MKKVFIFSQAMELGGAENALLGLLEAFDKTEYQIDLFLMRHTGELLKFIPGGVTLLPEKKEYASLAIPIREAFFVGTIRIMLGRIIGKFLARRFTKRHSFLDDNDVQNEYSHKFTVSAMPKIGDTHYDLAISFLTPHYFVLDKVDASQKIAWIHTDYSTIEIDRLSELKMWSQYDTIVSISEQVTKSFLSVFPSLAERVILVENITPVNYMEALAQKEDTISDMPADGAIRLLSIGRFCEPKNFDNVPDICRRILDAGINVKWYLIGYGSDEALIRQRIEEADLQDRVILLGKKDNPYPYIKACDLYVQPSRYEGKSVTVREAQMLCKPVVITRYATSASQLEDGVDGVIVPMDNEGCADGIINVVRDRCFSS